MSILFRGCVAEELLIFELFFCKNWRKCRLKSCGIYFMNNNTKKNNIQEILLQKGVKGVKEIGCNFN